MAAAAARYCAPRRSSPASHLMTLFSKTVASTLRRAFVLLLLLVGAGVARAQDLPEALRTTLEDADRLRAAGRMEEARSRYKDVLKSDPSVVQAYVGLGAIEHAAGRHEEALKIFVDGLARAPEERTLLFNAAASALQTGKAKDALGYVDRALARNDKDAALHGLRGTILQRLDRNEDAVTALKTAVKL